MDKTIKERVTVMAADALKEICKFLDLNKESKAEEAINTQYPF